MRNVIITYFHDFIKNFSKDGIYNIPNENVQALTQKKNAVCESLYEAKALPRKTPVRNFTGFAWCIVPQFVGTFELMLNTYYIKQMISDGATVDYKGTLDRVKI